MKTVIRLAIAAVSAASLAGLAAVPAHAGTGQFDGVNWADPRDNFADDALVLSGLTAADSYATVKAKAQSIAAEFYTKVGANTIRIPINPATVNSSRWAAYKGVIDGIRAQGARVIIAYWEGTNRDGVIDNTTAYNTMWDTVVAAYGSDSFVFFEPMNEPHGYTLSAWGGVAAAWLARYPNISRDRVVVDGQGYSENVTGVCADSRLNGTLLGLHNYAYWANRTYNQWLADWSSRIGSCASRTVITEFGATMNTGLNYSAPSSNNEVMYMQAATKTARDNAMGLVYWPGLRDGDSYSLTTRGGAGTNITLTVVNASGKNNVQYGYGF